MLKTLLDGRIWLVTQPDHGRLAGQLAAHWGSAHGFAPLGAPLPASVNAPPL